MEIHGDNAVPGHDVVDDRRYRPVRRNRDREWLRDRRAAADGLQHTRVGADLRRRAADDVGIERKPRRQRAGAQAHGRRRHAARRDGERIRRMPFAAGRRRARDRDGDFRLDEAADRPGLRAGAKVDRTGDGVRGRVDHTERVAVAVRDVDARAVAGDVDAVRPRTDVVGRAYRQRGDIDLDGLVGDEFRHIQGLLVRRQHQPVRRLVGAERDRADHRIRRRVEHAYRAVAGIADVGARAGRIEHDGIGQVAGHDGRDDGAIDEVEHLHRVRRRRQIAARAVRRDRELIRLRGDRHCRDDRVGRRIDDADRG